MNDNISLTVPYKYTAMMAAATMLVTTARELDPEKFAEAEAGKAATTPSAPVETVTPEPEVDTVEEETPQPAAAVFATEPEADVAPEAITPATGVELDSQGLPWDNRIHSSSKATLAKGGGWKKKRGLDPAIVEKVEAELRLVMSNPETRLQDPAVEIPTPAPEAVAETPAPTPAPAEAVPAPATASTVTTFPELMAGITKNGLSQEIVKGACEAVGIAALPLAAARPDLIPALAQRLGL